MKKTLRLTGGKLRGRKIPVIQSESIRPTGDRVRETLFNWLQTKIRGADCLDLFAGSGALGFEAISRGANKVTMVEKNHRVYQQLCSQCHMFNINNITLLKQDAFHFLTHSTDCFDIIFLDPPFYQQWLTKLIPLLKGKLQPQGLMYLENEKSLLTIDALETYRQSKAGNVSFGLFTFKEEKSI